MKNVNFKKASHTHPTTPILFQISKCKYELNLDFKIFEVLLSIMVKIGEHMCVQTRQTAHLINLSRRE